MKHFFAAWALLLLTLPALAQTYSIGGKITDKTSGEILPGATVQVVGNGQNTGDGADAEGRYKVANLKVGTYTVTASFVGYKPLTQTVKISTASVTAPFGLASDNASLDEVEVVATLAQERATPVAFSAVNEVKLRETLSNRDLPMILNETPGVYATQGSGGGTGDSRISVRGFDQKNVAVLINGVPVNDMENGAVFWSNWDLGDVTKSLQVQRGVSASKIAVPSVGGTINVLTKGFGDKQSALARVETGSNNYRKYSLMLSSGVVKGDWAFTLYGSRRTQDGWVSHAFDDAWTYFGNVSKRVGKHRLSLTGLGSPQRHGQRFTYNTIGTYSNEKAREIGAQQVPNGDRGFDFNNDWGYLNRYTRGQDYRRVSQGSEELNAVTNYYHKPQFNLNDFWQVNDRLFISGVAYVSFGNGGASNLSGGRPFNAAGQVDFQSIYASNYDTNPLTTRRDTTYAGERLSTNYLVNSVNSHRWYGFVVGGDYTLTDKLTLSAGVDGRSYRGIHYRQVRDLLGGDYALGTANANADPNNKLREGDRVGYNYDSQVNWLGGYTQLEYKTPLFSAVASATISQISYQRFDYFKERRLVVDGEDRGAIPFGTTRVVNGRTYTNADGEDAQTDVAAFRGYSGKMGANYNFTEHDNVFANFGYIRRVPFFNTVFDSKNNRNPDVRTEGITSAEIGYGITYPSMKVTLNAYYTLWANRSSPPTPGVGSNNLPITYNVRNVNARHMGIELAIAQEISRKVQLNAAISVGDWRWTGAGVVTANNQDGTVADGIENQPIYLDGVHVGDAAQNQFQLGLRYEPISGLFLRPSFLLFTKYYAGFNPNDLRDPSNRTDSYRVPTFRNVDLNMGYELPKNLVGEHVRLGLRASVLNVLNEFYLTDIPSGASPSPTDPSLLRGYFNRGRTFTVGLSATL